MEAEYWLRRWREGRTGWHSETVMPLLEKHWPALNVPRGARVLVPLCGKSLDMLWLASQGARVLGVELSPVAIEGFLAGIHLQAKSHTAHDGTHYVIEAIGDGSIEIINGDVFDVPEKTLPSCSAIYDRAALIAFPAPMRERYAREVYGRLPAGCRGLLITLEYPQHEMPGPPFSVKDTEVQRLFGARWDIGRLERRDILASQPAFSEKGVTALHTAVFRLKRQ